MTVNRWALVGVAAVLSVAILAGCSPEVSDDVPAEPDMSEEASETSINVDDLPGDVSPEGVIVAALLLQSGDIARAVEEGLVSPAEVEYAREAIASGTLQQWVDVAVVK